MLRLGEIKKLIVLTLIAALIIPAYAINVNAGEAQSSDEQHLVAYWPMEEGEGQQVSDASGNGNHGVLNAAAPLWTAGYLGKHSLQLTSAANRMEVATSVSLHALSATNQLTIAFWFKYKTSANYQGLFGFDDFHVALVGGENSDGARLQVLSGNYSENLITDMLIKPDEWQHVAIRINDAKIDFIINGEEKQSLSFENSEHRVALDGSFNIGYDSDTADSRFNYDDIRIYSKPVANAELKLLAEMFEVESEPPSAPELDLMGANHAVVNLQWSPSIDNDRVAEYELYQDGQYKTSLTGTHITVRQLAADREYVFQVRAKDRSGNFSALSNAIRAKTDATQSKADAAIGMNPAGVFDYSTELPFVDIFKMAREWNNNNPQELDLDENGWVKSLAPGQSAEAYMMLDLQGHYPSGEYTLLYDGEGVLEVREGHGVSITSQKQGEILIDVETPSNAGIVIYIRETNPANYIRNIRVIMPGFLETYEQQPFNPLFLERLKPFKVIRFMDWMRTNDNAGGDWNERSTATSYTQTTPQGIAVEYMVMLANELQSDAWFNMPTYADDHYVRQFATYVRDHLDPDLKAYIEYSNEIWNTAFTTQNRYAVEQAKLLGYEGSDHDLQAKFMGHRSRQIFEIWEDVFGGTGRLVRVMGGFAWDQAYSAGLSLQQDNAYEKTDAFAIAPYFGNSYGTEKAEFAKMAALDDIFADLQNELELSVQGSRKVYDYVSSLGIDLIAYEGGQHLAGSYYEGKWYPDDDQLTARLLEINRDPRMKDLYLQYFNGWKEAGGKMFANFSFVGSFSKWGSWGALEYLDQPIEEAPKYAALLEWIADNPIWWEETEVEPETEPEPIAKPAAPTNVQAASGDRKATISFSAPTPPVDSYIVTVTGSNNQAAFTVTGNSSPIIVTGLTNGVAYTFTVKAVNSAGESAMSNSAAATPVAVTTPPPIDPQPTPPTTPTEPVDPTPTTPTTPTEPGNPSPAPSPVNPPSTTSPDEEQQQTTAPEKIVPGDISGHWAEQAIKRAVAAGIAKGYSNGEFKPEQNISRAEFIVMLMRILQHEGDHEASPLSFSDKEKIGVWAQDAIAQAVAANIISGYGDGSFRPDQPVTRVEMAAIIARAFDGGKAAAHTSFADDDDIANWAKGAVQFVNDKGIMTGRGNKQFVPYATATRAEAVVVLVRLLQP